MNFCLLPDTHTQKLLNYYTDYAKEFFTDINVNQNCFQLPSNVSVMQFLLKKNIMP